VLPMSSEFVLPMSVELSVTYVSERFSLAHEWAEPKQSNLLTLFFFP
jgi:hypothetical protein